MSDLCVGKADGLDVHLSATNLKAPVSLQGPDKVATCTEAGDKQPSSMPSKAKYHCKALSHWKALHFRIRWKLEETSCRIGSS